MSGQPNAQAVLKPAAYTEHIIEIAGLRLRVQDYGTAGKPPMLCLHGGSANAHWYDFVAHGFSADYHLRAVDLRGHGDSQWDTATTPDYAYARHAADIHELTGKLDLRDFVLVGHSMGGMVSSVYTATYPGRVKALVVVDSNLTMTPERIANYNAVGNSEGRHYASQDEFIANYKVRPGGSTAAPEVLRHIAQCGGRRFEDGRWRNKADRKVYANRELVQSFPLWNSIKIPALLMKGERSTRLSAQAIAAVQSRAPQVKVAVVAHSDHHITLDNPAGFIQAAREFLATID